MADLIENGVVEEVSQEDVETQEKVTPEAAAEKTFTQAEVTEMIQQYVNQVVAKAHKEAEKNKKEDVKSSLPKEFIYYFGDYMLRLHLLCLIIKYPI